MKNLFKIFMLWLPVILVTAVSAQAQWTPAGCPGFTSGRAFTSALAADTNNHIYVAYQDNGAANKTTVHKYDGSSWTQVGSAGFSSAGDWQSFAMGADNLPYIAVSEYGIGASVYKYDGSSWSVVGSAGFSSGTVSNTSLAIDGNGDLYVAYRDVSIGGKATVMKYSGSSWSVVGTAGLSTGNSAGHTIVIGNNDTPYVVFRDDGQGQKATVLKYNGTSWVAVGSAAFTANPAVSTTMTMDANGTPYIAYKDGWPQGPVTVMKYNGSSWVNVGSAGMSAGYADHITLGFDSQGTLFVSYRDDANNLSISTQKFVSGSWTPVGTQGITSNTADQGSFVIAGNDNMYVAFRDFNAGSKLSVYKFGTTAIPVTASGPTSFCPGGTVTLSVSACTGSTFQWKKNGTNISGATSSSYVATTPGTYNVDVSYNSVTTTSSSVTVTYPADTTNPVLVGVPANTTASCDAVPAAANVTATDNCSTPTVSLNQITTTGAMPINGLSAFWTFNEGTGTTTADQSGNGNIGTLSSGASWVTGQVGDAVQLSGSTKEYVEIANGNGGDLDAQYSISMFAWLYPGTNGTKSTPIIQYDPNGWGTHLWQTGTNQLFVRFTKRNSNAFTSHMSANVLIPNQWNCVGATYDYSTGVATLWCNGTAVATKNIGQLQLSTNKNLRIGTVNFDSRRTNAKIDNVAIYDRVLSSTEISTLCAVTCPQNYTITHIWTATDAANNSVSASQTITVSDTTKPTLTVPSDITMNAANGQCSATATFQASATDNCSNDVTITYSQNSGTTFPVGTTTVTVTATDECNNATTGTFDVTVVDNQKPIVGAPADRNVNADNGTCSATGVSLGSPAVFDNCGIASVTNNAPASYSVGTTTVTWTITDIHGNSTTVDQNVTVTDNQDPTITCPADVTVNADSGQCTATNVNLGTPTTADNCGVEAVTNNAPATYAVGTTTITWTVTDYHGNTNTCDQTVTVVDNQNPIVATQNQTIYLDASGAASISTGDINNGSTDNCGIDSMSLDKTAFGCSDVGSNTVTLTVTDIHSNSATGTATVTVTDTVKPVITCPASVTVSCLTAPSNTGTATATDACGVDTITYADASTYSSNPADAAHYNYTITRTWTATDVNGNSNSCTQTITVQQLKLTASVTNILCNGDNSGSIDLTVTGGVGSLTYSWSNNATTEDISSLTAGTYTVTVTDSAGCSASATYTVTEPTMLSLTAVGVSPNPTVSGQSMNTIYLGYGPQSVTLSSTASGGTPGYSYSWSPTTGVNSPTSASTSVSPTVTTTYTLTVTDANGCTKTVSKTIYVMDVTHGNNKIVICHNGKTKKVPVNAVQAHLNHGDQLGECFKLKASKTKVTCYGGSDGALDVTVKGGVPPFSYSWSTGDTTEDLTGLSAGNYTLTVTAANNEVTTKTFKVKQNSKIKINKYVVDVKCHGDNTGKIYLSVSGGKPGYTYLWNDSSTSKHRFGLSAGTYSVTVKDSKGCTKTDTFAVTQPDSPLVVSASVTNISCSNYYSGAIDLTVSGGTGPYTYYWSKNNQSWSWWWYWWWYNKCTKQDLSGISAGTYKVVVKDKNGCTVIKTVTVAPANKPNVSINVSPNPTVSGQAQYTIFKGYGPQSVTLSANVNGGTSPYTYSWTPTNSLSTSTASSTTASPNSTTKYYVKVTDADGCSKTVSRRIYVENVQWYNEKIRICHNGKNKKVPYNSVATYLANGATLGYCRYSCKGCPEPDEEGVDEDNTDEQSISSIGSLDDITNNIRLYPNPNTGTFTIELPSNEAADIVVSNVSGQVVYRNKVENTRKVLVELNSMAAGVFMVQVVQGLDIYHINVTVN